MSGPMGCPIERDPLIRSIGGIYSSTNGIPRDAAGRRGIERGSSMEEVEEEEGHTF